MKKERGPGMIWIYFKHKSLHEYARVPKGQYRMEIKSMMDLVLVKRDMLQYVQQMRTVRRIGRVLSNY